MLVLKKNTLNLKILCLVTLFFFLAILFISKSAFVEGSTEYYKINASVDNISVHLFYGQGCPHCSQLRLFLDEIKPKYSNLIIHEHEVYSDNDERLLFEKMCFEHNISIQGVPTLFIGDKVIVGFSDSIGKSIEEEIEKCIKNGCKFLKNKTNNNSIILGNSSHSNKKINFITELTIPVVIAAAAVDAINPCAFAVLIILMTAALTIADKKRALKFGLAFTVSIYISYFLMGLGLFSVLQATGISHTFYIVVTCLAVVVGLLNIKDFFWYGKGFLMEVPISWRPTMKKLLNSATSPLGAFVVGFIVSLFELPCTGGPYIVILGLLAKEVTREIGISYLLLYNLVFVLPLLILSFVIYKGLSTTEKLEKIRQEKIKVLHLIAGLLMIGIATIMILSIILRWI